MPQPIRADAAHYVQYAVNLHEHGVFSLGTGVAPQSDSFRSPGYPVFLWLHRVLFGAENLYTAARLTQALLDTLSVLLAFFLARQVLSFPGALVAMALTALSPHLVANTGYLLTETLTTFGLLVGLGLLHRLAAGGGSGWLCGLAFAVTALTSESLAPLPWLLAGLVYWRAAPPRPARLRRQLLVMLAVCALAQGGWALRGALVLAPDALRGSSRALQTISHGTYPGCVYQDPRWRYMPYRDDPEQPRFGADFAYFCTVFARRVGERPWRYVSWYALEKPFYLWGFDGLQASRDIYTYEPSQSLYDRHAAAGATLNVMRLLHWPVVALGLLGVLCLGRRRRDPAPGTTVLLGLAVCMAWGTLIGVVFAPWPRYVIVMRPELFVLATWGAWRVAHHFGERASRRAATAEVPATTVG